MNASLEYIEEHKNRFVTELFEILKVPSISADPAYKEHVMATAILIKEHLIKAGVDKAEIMQTSGYPVVYGEKIIDPSLPTIVVYGHYDVQPADPIELWDADPFDPVIRKTELHPEGAIFARGACDDKGQMFMHVKAFEAMNKTGELACNVKFMIEGEEEVGSSSLEAFLKEHKDMLSGDVILISDTGMLSMDQPSITTGLRGLSAVEVKVTGPNRDLHSGLYGGAVANPAIILAKMIASLHDENGRITVEGFYDKVEELSRDERKLMSEAPFNQDSFNKALDIKEEWGEKEYSTMERTSIRPTLDVNGMWSGYIGEGSKTIIPSTASAKITMRLVPDQNPDEISQLFITHFKKIAPNSVRVDVVPHHGGYPYVSPTHTPGYLAAEKALADTFGKRPIPVRSGGSIPIVTLFERELGMKSILLGFGLDTDAIHSPNEHYGIKNFEMGIKTIPRFHKYFTELMR